MADQPIPVSTANAQMTEYVTYMTGLGVNMTKQTKTVSFGGATLSSWLAGVMPFTDELRICLGVYPTGATRAGRINTILWPYKNGVPAVDGSGHAILPFNEGTGQP